MGWQLRIILLVATLSLPGVATAQRDTDFPYQALTLNEKTIVRSGPADVHYETDELTSGQVVNVYRHDPGGWCAIQPPQGSFSLVPESAIRKLDDANGIVTVDGVQSWVGTRMGSVDSPMWQVKLKIDESVKILGEASWPNPDGNSTIWYQIAPPSGEFRWVQISDLQLPENLMGPSKEANDTNNAGTGNVQAAKYSLTEDDDGFGRVVQAALQTPVEIENSLNSGWRKAKIPPPVQVTTSQTPIPDLLKRPFKSPAVRPIPPSQFATEPVARVARASGVSPAMPNLDLSPPDLSSPLLGLSKTELGTDQSLDSAPQFPVLGEIGKVTKSISELELLLNKELIRDPNQWRIRTLANQAMAIKETSADSAEKLQVDRFLQKIKQCKRIRENYETAHVGARSGSSSKSGLPAAGSNGSGSKGSNTRSSDQPVGSGVDQDLLHSMSYDAYGWLNELVSNSAQNSRGNQPSYVLEDDNGRIIYHITPAPGLNLHRHLRSKVGVTGRRGYHRRLQLNHVTADRVVVLDKLR